MRRPCLLLASVALLLSAAPPAHAGPNADAKVALHLVPSFSPGRCDNPDTYPRCDRITTAGKLVPTFYYVFILVIDANAGAGVSALHFGINWQPDIGPRKGVYMQGWALCAVSWTDYPPDVTVIDQAPYHSFLIRWNTTTECQRNEPGGPGTGVVAMAGYFFVGAYAPGTMRISPADRRPTDFATRKVLVYSCANQADVIEDALAPHSPSRLGSVTFSADGTVPGYNPCSAVMPVLPTTWSRIKGRFAGE